MAQAKLEKTVKVTLELSGDEANLLASVLLNMKWGSGAGLVAERIFNALQSAGCDEFTYDVEWDEDCELLEVK